MSSPINKNEFIQGDLGLKELRNNFKRTLDILEQFDDKLKKTSNTLRSDYAGAEKLTVQNLEKRNKIEQQSKRIFEEKKRNTKNMHAVQKEMLSLDKKLEKAEAQKIAAYSKENKELLKLRAEKNKINKATRDEIKQAERAKNAYSKLADETTALKNDSKRLGAELLALEKAGKRNSRQWNETNKRYKQVTSQARTADSQLKKLDATVGDNQRNVGNYTKATRGLSKALGALGVAAGVGAIFRNLGRTVADYNQATTDLAAISGKTTEELEPLNKQARELGATTQFSATQITGLQIELAKLGFTTQEITDSTGGIANFAAATGVEIPRAAALAGSALRAFNLDASEIDRVVSTLGVATTKTALDFSKLENGLSTVAPVAASFGFSIEDTTALLGQLSNAGFDASSAATATRNILLNLADSGGDLAKQLGRPVKNAEDLAAGLQELQSRGIDLAEALELTDKRSVAAFSTFIQGSDSLVDLRDSITDVNDELTDMANKRLQSVGGAVKLLESAWEGFVLDLNESIGASDAFNTVIRFVADNLTTIIGALAEFAAILLIIKARQKIINSGMIEYVQNLFKAKTAQTGLNASMKDGTSKAGKFGKTLKGIGWGVIIGLAIELGKALYDIASGAARARFETELLEKAQARLGGASTKVLDSVNAKLDEQLTLIERRLELGEITEKQAKDQRNAIIEASKQQLNSEKELAKEQLKNKKARLAVFDEVIKKIEEESGFSIEYLKTVSDTSNMLGGVIESFGGQDLFNQISETEAEVKALEATVNLLEGGTGKLNDKQSELNHQFKVYNKNQKEAKTVTDQTTESIKKQNDEFVRFEDSLTKIIKDYEEYRKERKELLEIDNEAIEQADLQDEPEPPPIPDIEEQKDYFQSLVEGVKLANDILQEEYDRRIKMEEQVVSATQRAQDRIAAAAAQGTDKAEESLKAQIEAEREALAEQERLRKKKERAQFITTALQNVQNQLADGKPISEAVASTVGLKAALTALFAGFDGFYKGTESAPGGFAWVHEKGGEMITDKAGRIKEVGNNKGAQLRYLDKGDKVFTHEKTKQILSSNNHLEGAASVAQRVQSNSLGNADVIREMRRNNELMSRLPQSFLTAEKVGSAIKLVTMDKRSGRIRRNTQKIR